MRGNRGTNFVKGTTFAPSGHSGPLVKALQRNPVQVCFKLARVVTACDGRNVVALPVVLYLHVEAPSGMQVGRSPLALAVHQVPAVLPDVLGLLVDG